MRCRFGRRSLFPIGWGTARCRRCFRAFSVDLTKNRTLYEISEAIR